MWSRPLLRAKVKWMGNHLLISLGIFVPIFYLLWVRWFPPPLFFTDGGIQGLKIMIPVDLIIGPLLTFIIFNPAKPRRELVLDLSIIAAVQLAALFYGYTAVDKRSIQAVVYSGGSFVAVQKQVFEKQQLPEHPWDRFGEGPVYWGYQREPVGNETKSTLAFLSSTRLRLAETYALLVPLSEHWEWLKTQALDIEALGKDRADIAEGARRVQEDNPGRKLYYFRLMGQDRNAIIALDEQGALAGTLYMSWD